MSLESKNTQPLRSFCQNRSSFKTKIALFSFYEIIYSPWTETLILLLEYLQIMAQIILSAHNDNYNSVSNTYFSKIIVYFFKLVSPSHLLVYNDSDATTSAVLITLLCLTFGKLVLFGYVIWVSLWDSNRVNSWLICLWRWIFKLQTRVMYFVFTSFWVKAIIEVQDNGFKILGMSDNTLIGLASLLLTIEFFLSLALEIQFSYVLPTRNLLSSKNNTLQIITLFQKLIFQILAILFRSSSSLTGAWIMSTLGIAINGIRDYQFTTKFPLYNLKALVMQRGLLCLVMSLSLAHFFNTILEATSYLKANMNFVIFTWIITSLLSIKVAHGHLKAKILGLLSSNQKDSPEILVHKVVMTQQLKQEETRPGNCSLKYQFSYLVASNLTVNIYEIFGVPKFLEADQRISEETLSKIYLLYFESLLAKFPENSLIKLHTALACFQNSEPYTKTVKILCDIENNTRSSTHLTSSLLLYEIEKSMLMNSRGKEEEDLHLTDYLKSKIFVEKLKEKMLKQTELYIKVCENILSETSNIEEIYNSAQKISNLKSKIQRRINNLPHKIPEYYISPYLHCAEYDLNVNHSQLNFEKYSQVSAQKFFKYEKSFKDPQLLPENLYQDSNAFLLLSTQKADSGKILHHSQSLVNLCGTLSHRNHVSSLFSPSLQLYYENLFKQSMKPQDHGLIQKTHKTFLFNKSKKYLIEANFCLKYHPYLAQGLCLDMIIRPMVDKKSQFLLIKHDGEIEGASKQISKLLNFGSSLKLLSYDLYNAHLAFNIVLNKEQQHKDLYKSKISRFQKTSINITPLSSQHMSEEKALEVYTAFTTEDQKIQLNPPSDNNLSILRQTKSHSFYARIQPVTYGDITLKLVSLRPVVAEHHISSNVFDNTVIKLHPTVNETSVDLNTEEFGDDNDNAQPVSIFTRHTLMTDVQQTSPKNNSPSTQADQLPLITVTSETRRFFADTLVSSFRKKEGKDSSSSRKKKVEIRTMNSLSDEHEIQKEEHEVKAKIRKHKSSHHSSQKSVEKAGDKAFKATIISKSYPKSFIVLCLIFYGVVSMTFAAQIIMKSASDKTMQDLQIKKDLLKYSQERSYKAALIQINALGACLIFSGIYDLGVASSTTDTIVDILQIRMNDMKAANDEILKHVYSLDKEFQRQLFKENVEISGTYIDGNKNSNSHNGTAFQAVQEITNAVKALAGLPMSNSSQAARIFEYLNANIMDDFQFESLEATDLFIKSVDKQKESYQNLIDSCLMMTPFLLFGIGILLIFIIWSQHGIAKKNMKAFIKISPVGVQEVLDRIVKFRKGLISQETTFESKWLSHLNDFPAETELNHNNNNSSNRHSAQIIHSKEFGRRYLRHIVKVAFYISLLIFITIWDLVTTQKAIKVIYNRQAQLQYANYIENRVTSGYAAYGLMYSSNNTMFVEHQLASHAVFQGDQETKKIQREISTKFLEIDNSYNPEVKRILFDNNPQCKGFTPDNVKYCEILLGFGQPMNMMVALSAFQRTLETKYTDFITVDKSNMTSILDVAYENIDTFLPNFAVIAHEAKMIADVIDESLTEKITENKNARSVIMIVFSISLVVVSVLIWFDILRVIREVYNDFKKVLQIFPPNMVLASYLLKKFLQKTTTQSILH